MRGVYTAQSVVSQTVAKTLVLLQAPATMVFEILSAQISNADNDVNEQFQAALQRVNSLGTPVGTALVPAPTELGSGVSLAVATGNLTTEPTSYAVNTEIGQQGSSLLGSWRFDPLPEERVYVSPSGAWGLQLLTAVLASTLVATITYREIGG